jgi:hypothetical protein
MFKHQTLHSEGYELDNILSQKTDGLIEQKLVTLYRDKGGFIYEHTTTRSYTQDDYYDSNHNKYIG